MRKRKFENTIQTVYPNMKKIKSSKIQTTSNSNYIKLNNVGKKEQTKTTEMTI